MNDQFQNFQSWLHSTLNIAAMQQAEVPLYSADGEYIAQHETYDNLTSAVQACYAAQRKHIDHATATYAKIEHPKSKVAK